MRLPDGLIRGLKADRWRDTYQHARHLNILL